MKKFISRHKLISIAVAAFVAAILCTVLFIPFIEALPPAGQDLVNPCPQTAYNFQNLCSLDSPSTLADYMQHPQRIDTINWNIFLISFIVLFVIFYVDLRLFFYVLKRQKAKNKKLNVTTKILLIVIILFVPFFLSFILSFLGY